jgi:hypothetical protein
MRIRLMGFAALAAVIVAVIPAGASARGYTCAYNQALTGVKRPVVDLSINEPASSDVDPCAEASSIAADAVVATFRHKTGNFRSRRYGDFSCAYVIGGMNSEVTFQCRHALRTGKHDQRAAATTVTFWTVTNG